MTYSIKVRTGQTTVGIDGAVVAEQVVAVFWDDERIGQVTHTRHIKPEDDITGDTSLAAKLADTARKAGSDERDVEVVTR